MKQPVCISYPKSGRTWLRVMLNELNISARFDHLGTGNDKQSYGLRLKDISLAKLHGYDEPVIFLYRHPIDVAVSFFHHCTKRKPVKWKRKLSWTAQGRIPPKNINDFVKSDRFGVPKIVRFNLGCVENLIWKKNCLFIAYEDMQADTEKEITRIVSFLGENRSGSEIRSAVENSRFDIMQRKEKLGVFAPEYGTILIPKNEHDKNSFKVRRGKIHGYIDELDHETKVFCEKFIENENYWTRVKQLIEEHA